MLALTACNNSSDTINNDTIDTTVQANISTPPDNSNHIDSIEELTEIDDVISVTNLSFSSQINGALAYKVLFNSADGKLSADVVLPKDYTRKNHPVLIYFPETTASIDNLAINYANNGIIVIRFYSRGYDESEGLRDLGGENDLADAQKLIAVFDSASFIKNSKIFVAGSSEGSIIALRLLAEDTEHRISGCALVDAITDLRAFELTRGEKIQNLFNALIGNTYEEAPNEYELRSAVNFCEKLDRPILMLHYLQNPFFPVEQTDRLYDLLKTSQDCSYYKIDLKTSDFTGEGLQRLLSWINKYE